jgi:hypothetical protein
MTTPTPAAATPTSSPGTVAGPRVRTALIVGLVGVVVGIVSVVALARVVFDVFDAPTYRIPGTVRVHLGSGDYVVYEHSRYADLYDTVGAPRRVVVTISARTVHITGPSGSDVAIDPSPSSSTINEGSDRFVSALGFHASSDGTYTLRFDGRESSEVMVQRTFGDQVRHNVGWIVAVLAGGLLLVLGCVLLVVGLLRRNSAQRRAFAATGAVAPIAPIVSTGTLPPPAWHPDPTREHRLRYWDGARWTEHTSE